MFYFFTRFAGYLGLCPYLISSASWSYYESDNTGMDAGFLTPPCPPMVTPHLIFLFVEIETWGFDRSMVTIYEAPH